MKHFTLFLCALLISTMSFAAKTTAVVTASANAGYTIEGALFITGLSATEVNQNGILRLAVYSWTAPGGATTGYAAQLFIGEDEAAFCDEGLLVSQDQEGALTISGKMLGYPYDYQFNDLQISPKKAGTIQIAADNMEVSTDMWEVNDLILSASAEGYVFEISLFGGRTKQYGTYDINTLFATANGSAIELVENTVATFSLEGELAKFEGAFVHGVDTLELTLTGEPYVDPADILPTDTLAYTITKAYIGKMSGFNTVSGNNDDIQIKIQVPNGNWFEGVTREEFSYASFVKVAGQKLEILRGELKVVEEGTIKTATIGVLCSDKIWYNIIATTAEEHTTSVDNLPTTLTPTKCIKNGQLIIIQNGVKYNAAGVVIQ